MTLQVTLHTMPTFLSKQSWVFASYGYLADMLGKKDVAEKYTHRKRKKWLPNG